MDRGRSMIKYLAVLLMMGASLAQAITLYIHPPTTRENGSELWSTDIDYYEVYRNGELYLTVMPDAEDASALFETLEDGDYSVRVYDIEGLVSGLSDPLSINNAVRSRPNPPGLGRRPKK